MAANFAAVLLAVGAANAWSHALSEKIILGWAVLIGAYFLASLVASVTAARRFGWKLLPYLPVTFAVFHMSYGLGFLIGFVYWYWPFARSASALLGELFVGVTR